MCAALSDSRESTEKFNINTPPAYTLELSYRLKHDIFKSFTCAYNFVAERAIASEVSTSTYIGISISFYV